MSEPTLGDIVSLIQSLERKMDQRFDQLEQAVHELKDDIKVHREEIDFLNDQMHAQKQKNMANTKTVQGTLQRS